MKFFTATSSDIPRIEECARECCAEHGKSMVGLLSWENYRQVWERLYARGDGIMFLYEDDAGKIIGGVGVAKYQEPLTAHLRAAQVFVYVKPEYRGKLSFRKLIHSIELWAIENKCQEITMPWLDTMPEKTEDYYKRMGYWPLQTLYVKEL